MREILFRGKSTDSGEWLYGAYSPYYWDIIGERENNPQIIIFDEKTDDDGLWAEVIPKTLGQYTGLTDKNGKKIFEGDIVLCKIIGLRETVIHKGVVEYLNDSFTVNIEGIVPPQKIIWFSIQNGDVEVIGNIHDNSELLN